MRIKLLSLFLSTSLFCLGQIEESNIDFSLPLEKEIGTLYPVYKGCNKSKTNYELKKCASDKISSFIGRKFDTTLPNRLGLSPGKKQITIYFSVDITGTIVVTKVTAPHIELEKEARKIFKQLPPFKSPAVSKGKPFVLSTRQTINILVD